MEYKTKEVKKPATETKMVNVVAHKLDGTTYACKMSASLADYMLAKCKYSNVRYSVSQEGVLQIDVTEA